VLENYKWSYRLMKSEDIPSLLKWYNNQDLHETANAKPFHPYTLEELTEYWGKKLGRKNARYFAILLGITLIGRVSLKNLNRSTDIEYSILIGDYSLYSKGLGTSITRQMLKEAFSDMNISNVQLNVRQDNSRAIRCYEKCGFKDIDSFLEDGVWMKKMQLERKEYINCAYFQ
jgi:RimJ/RimL family protein N-acetyltransferase